MVTRCVYLFVGGGGPGALRVAAELLTGIDVHSGKSAARYFVPRSNHRSHHRPNRSPPSPRHCHHHHHHKPSCPPPLTTPLAPHYSPGPHTLATNTTTSAHPCHHHHHRPSCSSPSSKRTRRRWCGLSKRHPRKLKAWSWRPRWVGHACLVLAPPGGVGHTCKQWKTVEACLLLNHEIKVLAFLPIPF